MFDLFLFFNPHLRTFFFFIAFRKEERERGREKEKQLVASPMHPDQGLYAPEIGMQPETSVCALTGN